MSILYRLETYGLPCTYAYCLVQTIITACIHQSCDLKTDKPFRIQSRSTVQNIRVAAYQSLIMLSYSCVATFLSNFEYWCPFSLIESGTNPNLTKNKTLRVRTARTARSCLTCCGAHCRWRCCQYEKFFDKNRSINLSNLKEFR